MYQFWTSEEEHLLVKGRRDGLSYEELAERLPGRSLKAVKEKAGRMAITASNFNWSEEKLAQVLQLKLSGKTWASIASILGTSSASLRNKMWRLRETS